MEIRMEADGPVMGSPAEVMEMFVADTQSRQSEWNDRVRDDPDAFRLVEREIAGHYAQGASQLVAAVLGTATQTDIFQESAQQARRESSVPLKSPERRTVRLRLLSGLIIFVTTLYCPPKKRKADDGPQQTQLQGLYPELAALGCSLGCSPMMAEKVARTVAMSPSINLARDELKSQGITLDRKTVRRIAEQFGEQLLAMRRAELLSFRAGTLPQTDELAGRRVAVQIDGGRLRTRKTASERGHGKRRAFTTKWREPKVLTIFTFDKSGRMEKKDSFRLIDGTLQGPDHVAELVACHLWRLGAARAECVAFVSDGAPWIWERLEWIRRRCGLSHTRVSCILDYYHAAQHVGLAVKACGLPDDQCRELSAALRKKLKRGWWKEVVCTLLEHGSGIPEDSDFWTEIAYLQKHGEASHLSYGKYRQAGLPIGSGAIESTIRRSINLRLKGNSIYWEESNAEAVLAVRSLILANQWESTMPRLRSALRRDRRRDWHWAAPDMGQEMKSPRDIQPPTRQTHTQQQLTSA